MKKDVASYVPLLCPEDSFWVLRDFSLSALFAVRPWAGEGRSGEQFDRAAAALGSLLEMELCAGATISLALVVLEGPDPDLVRSFHECHKASPIIEERLEFLGGRTIHRRWLVGINLPSVTKTEKGEQFRHKFLGAKRRLKRLCDAIGLLLGEIFEDVRLLSPDEAFLAWKELLSGRKVTGLLYPEVVKGQKVQLPPSPAEQMVVSDVVHKDDVLLYGGRQHRAYSCSLPPSTEASATFEALLRVTYPCRIVFHFHVPASKHDRERILRSERALARFLALGQSREPNLDKSDAIDALLKEVREEAASLMDFSGFAVVSGHGDEINARADMLVGAFGEIEMDLVQESVYSMSAYFSWAVPGFGGARIPDSRKYVVSSRTAPHMVPVYGEFMGDDQPIMLFENRQGSLVGFSPISERQAKWGGLIVAPSGSGKTFLSNSILYNLANLKYPPFVGIVDMALVPSYQSIVSSLGGTTLLLDASGQNTINPFEFPFPLSSPPERHIAFLREMLLPSVLEASNRIQLQFLERSLRRMYQMVLSPNKAPKVIEVGEGVSEKFWRFETWMEAREHFIRDYIESRNQDALSAAMYAHSQMMPTIHDLLDVLTDPENAMVEADRRMADDLRRQLAAAFSGVRGKLFGGPTSANLGSLHNEGLIYVYFGDLVNFQELLSTAFLVAHHHIKERAVISSDEEAKEMARVFGDDWVSHMRRRKKVLILDEVHNLGGSPHCMLQIERNYRQGRTLGLSTIAITQGLREIAERDAGKAMVENAALTILLRHSTPEAPNELAVDYVSKTLGLTPKMRKLLLGLERTDSHSDMIVLSEGIGTGVVRYSPTPTERWIGTTHNLETQVRGEIIGELVKRGYLPNEALALAVRLLGELYPRGLARSGDDPKMARQRVLDAV